MNTFAPVAPMKALEMVEAASLEAGRQIIADFTAAGLVKTYALVIEMIDARGVATCVRGATIPPTLWQRIILEDAVADVWNSGTVRLDGSELIGGALAVVITGITFNPKHLGKLLEHHGQAPETAPRAAAEAPARAKAADAICKADVAAAPVAQTPQSQRQEPAAIKPGAIWATVREAMSATGLGRTKINELMNDGTLVRKKFGRATRIEVASIRALAENLGAR